MREITIEVATTWIRFKCSRTGDFNGINIGYYVSDNCQEREFDPRTRTTKLVARYTRYDEETGYAYLPRYMLDTLMRYVSGYDADLQIHTVPVEPVPTEHVDMPLDDKLELRPMQVAVVEFLTNESCGFRPLALATGMGKTVSSIYAACKLGYPTLISLALLIDQWYKSILTFTKISRDDIYVVKGFDALANLWKGIENGFRPKIILFSMRTLSLYAVSNEPPYNELPPYDELLRKLAIGVKIVDECHLNFNTNTLIDLYSNVKMNIYLSATYQRSNYQGRKIFNLVFPEELKFGEQFVKKYTTVYLCAYHLSINPRDLGRFKSFKGYNHAKYENYLVRYKNVFKYFMDIVISNCLYRYYDNYKKSGQHCLILVQTQQFACAVADHLLKTRSDTVSVFFAGSKDVYGKEENLESDVIISTIKSCGVGRDIKNLKTCISTVSFSSPPQCTQILGRLRELPNEETIFVDIYNTEVQQHIRHMYNRSVIYDIRAAKVNRTRLN
jgi:superfamily II DNA or RNA helicase